MVADRAGRGCSVVAMRLLLPALLILLAAPALARADEPAAAAPAVDQPRAQAAMAAYFEGEIHGGYALIGMGVAGLLAGGFLYRHGAPTARGASYPLLGIGLVHLVAGAYVGIASSRRIDTFTTQIASEPSAFVARERPRMTGVSTTLTALKIAEVVLIAGGLSAAAVGWRTDRPRLRGAGLALALEAAATLGFDVVAAQRATRYRTALAQTEVAVWVEPDTGVATATVMYAGRF